MEVMCPSVAMDLEGKEEKKPNRFAWAKTKQLVEKILRVNTWTDHSGEVGNAAIVNALKSDLADPEARAALRLVFEHMAWTANYSNQQELFRIYGNSRVPQKEIGIREPEIQDDIPGADEESEVEQAADVKVSPVLERSKRSQKIKKRAATSSKPPDKGPKM